MSVAILLLEPTAIVVIPNMLLFHLLYLIISQASLWPAEYNRGKCFSQIFSSSKFVLGIKNLDKSLKAFKVGYESTAVIFTGIFLHHWPSEIKICKNHLKLLPSPFFLI